MSVHSRTISNWNSMECSSSSMWTNFIRTMETLTGTGTMVWLVLLKVVMGGTLLLDNTE